MSLFHKKDTKREVFGQMFTELYPRLVRYATQLLDDGEEARDIVGSVMEQAWKQFEKLEPETGEPGFILPHVTPALTV